MAVAAQERQEIPWWLVLIQGIVAIVVGFLLLTQPLVTAIVLAKALAIYWVITGILSLVSIFVDSRMWGWKLVVGILGIWAGIFILDGNSIVTTLALATIFVIVLGVQGLIMGVVNLIQAFQGGGWGAGVIGVLSIMFGMILLAHPFIAALGLPWIFGTLGIVFGIFTVIAAFRLR